MRVNVFITLKAGFWTRKAKPSGWPYLVGFSNIRDVRHSKAIALDLDDNQDIAYQQVKDMCEKLLANLLLKITPLKCL